MQIAWAHAYPFMVSANKSCLELESVFSKVRDNLTSLACYNEKMEIRENIDHIVFAVIGVLKSTTVMMMKGISSVKVKNSFHLSETSIKFQIKPSDS